MTPEQERADGILHGQTLRLEWKAYCRAAREAAVMRDLGDLLRSGLALIDAKETWRDAVDDTFDLGWTRWHLNGGCDVAGEVYEPLPDNELE